MNPFAVCWPHKRLIYGRRLSITGRFLYQNFAYFSLSLSDFDKCFKIPRTLTIELVQRL